MNNSRIIKNTLVLYVRVLFLALVTLYTVRVVLDVLGVNDYGVFYLVGGLVSLFAFLPGTLASSTQRFISVALGEEDDDKLNRTFTMSVLLYLVIAIFSVVVLEGVGLLFFESLNIASERMESARVLYHFTVASFVFSILSAPFIAIIIAHEDMGLYAYISIFDGALKLIIVLSLEYFSGDKLESYGLLLLIVSMVTSFSYLIVCFIKYSECKFKQLFWDYRLMRQMLGFTGWTLFGQVSTVARTHAVTVLLNQMYGPIVIAARSIAVSTANQMTVLSINFNTSLYAPIIKSYSSGKKEEMYQLVYSGSKLTFYLMWVFALPILIEMGMVLNLWLKDVPDYAVSFTRLALIESLIMALSLPLATAARAPGSIKYYELCLGSIQVGILIVSWLALRAAFEPHSVFVVAIIANVLMFAVRLWIVSDLTGISVREYLIVVINPVFKVVILSFIGAYGFSKIVIDGRLFSLLVITISFILSLVVVYTVGIDKSWREKVNQFLVRILKIVNMK